MILHLHHRYRHTGGEERAVADLVWLTRTHLGEDAALLERDSARTSTVRASAGMLRGGLAPDEVERIVRRTGARILHAHNLHPTFGWRALAGAQRAGARVILHLHQYRLVCAVGVCFTGGSDCVRCHGRNTWPGVRHNCRGSVGEAVVYATTLAAWQRRTTARVDACVAPSRFAAARVRTLAAPLPPPHILPHVVRPTGEQPSTGERSYALVTSRLTPEKGIETAIAACRRMSLPLVIAGEGPAYARLAEFAHRVGGDVRFVGRHDEAGLVALRRDALVVLVPSRFGETFGLAAAEAMTAGVPVVAARVGALPELVPDDWLVPVDDAVAMAAALHTVLADPTAGERARRHIAALTSPEVVAPRLAELYDAVAGPRP